MPSDIASRFAQRDLAAMLAVSDARRREREASKARARSDAGLEAVLREEYARRGETFSWETYFIRNGF